MFDFGEARRVRRTSLTPMIDVVFLLVVFFMLAAQFGGDKVLPIGGAAGGSGSSYQGAPRLVSVTAEGLRLNGEPIAAAALVTELEALMPEPGGLVVLRPDPGVPVARTVEVVDLLRIGGIRRIVLAEPAR